MKKFDHPNIIKLYDLFFHNNFYYVVMELCEGGPVTGIAKKRRISERNMIKIMKQLLSAVAYIH